MEWVGNIYRAGLSENVMNENIFYISEYLLAYTLWTWQSVYMYILTQTYSVISEFHSISQFIINSFSSISFPSTPLAS